MICDFCKENDATVFLEMHGPASTRKLKLCRECAAKLGVTEDPKAISALFQELSASEKKVNDEDKKACPVCGTQLGFLKRTKQAGCPECYSIFKDQIKDILSKQGIKGPYKGVMPNRLSTFRSVLTDRIALQAKLEESIKNEDYEKAAIYRDYLKALEKSPVAGGEDE